MTAAGLNPSRIQEQALAVILAKVQAVKRKRAAEMDVDMDDVEVEGDDDEGDWMDVDGEDKPTKRVKSNSGGAVAVDQRRPRTNRQFAGMWDEAVQNNIWCLILSLTRHHVCATLGRSLIICL
jgi:nucleolar GTP-binding protein